MANLLHDNWAITCLLLSINVITVDYLSLTGYTYIHGSDLVTLRSWEIEEMIIQVVFVWDTKFRYFERLSWIHKKLTCLTKWRKSNEYIYYKLK